MANALIVDVQKHLSRFPVCFMNHQNCSLLFCVVLGHTLSFLCWINNSRFTRMTFPAHFTVQNSRWYEVLGFELSYSQWWCDIVCSLCFSICWFLLFPNPKGMSVRVLPIPWINNIFGIRASLLKGGVISQYSHWH